MNGNRPVRIIFVEDVLYDLEIALRELRKEKMDFVHIQVENKVEYLAALADFQPDIILSDFSLPTFDGLHALKLNLEYSPHVPVIIITGTLNEEIAVNCLKAGAVDYVLKEQIKRLPYAIAEALEQKEVQIQKLMTEIALRESESNYRMLFESNPHPMWIYDIENMHFIAVNNMAVDKYGYSQAEFLLMKSSDIEIDENNNSALPDQFDNNVIHRGICQHKMKNGAIIWVEYSNHFIEFEGRNALFVLAIDITERKKTETELIAAKDRAEENDRLKTAFLNNISHEIRTPMNIILGYSELLMKLEKADARRDKYLHLILQNSTNLLKIINDIVETSKIQSKQVVVNLMVTDLDKLFMDIYIKFKPKSQAKNIEFTQNINLEPSQTSIITDNIKLLQILGYLLDNAIKFTSEGKVELSCKQVNSDLEFCVSDTGIGIPAEKQEEIFEIFRQVEDGMCRKYGGTGLGLSISKSYIELLNGKIWIFSEEKKGTSIYFTIPFAPHIVEKQKKPTVINDFLTLENQKILIVEDEDLNLEYITEILTETKCTFLYAKNGQEAIEVCLFNPDILLVLMDLKMPVMNGIEATQKIKQIQPNLPIIAQTSFADKVNEILQFGFDDFISKPIDKNALFDIISKFATIN